MGTKTVSKKLFTVSLTIFLIAVTYCAELQYPVIKCNEQSIILNDSQSNYTFKLFDYSNKSREDIEILFDDEQLMNTYTTFTTIGIDHIRLFISQQSDPLLSIDDYPTAAASISPFFNTSSFRNQDIYDNLLIYSSFEPLQTDTLVSFDIMQNTNNRHIFLSMNCNNSHMFPFQPSTEAIECPSSSITNSSSVYYFSFINTEPHDITMTFLVESMSNMDTANSFYVDIYSYDKYYNSWVSSTISSDVQSVWLYDNTKFTVFKNISSNTTYYLVIGDLTAHPTSYSVTIMCTNKNTTLPITTSSNITCGSHKENQTVSIASKHYYSFQSEIDQLLQVFRFESCSDCSNIFWIFGHNHNANEWILDTYTNYFNCTGHSYCNFQFIARPQYVYYLGVSGGQYSFDVFCSKIISDIQCPKFENTSSIVTAELSQAYFLHFYRFQQNHTIDIKDSHSTNVTHQKVNLKTLVLSSCNSSIITELGLIPIHNITNDPAVFYSNVVVFESDCLLSTTNLPSGEYLIGIISYHDGYNAFGEYYLNMTCINSFPYEITDTLRCGDFQLDSTTSINKKHFYAFTLTEHQNKTIFDSCHSKFDNYLAIWNFNNSIKNWSRIDYCNDCGDCGESTILEESYMNPGNYYLEIGGVDSFYDNFGEYLLSVSCSDSAPGYPVIDTISCHGNPMKGNSRTTQNNFYNADGTVTQYSFSYYSFTINKNVTSYSFQFDACSTDVYLQIFKWNGFEWIIVNECKDIRNQVNSKPCGKCKNNSHETSWAILPNDDAVNGKYYLGVLNKYGTGGYEVYMDCKYFNRYEEEIIRDRKLERTVIYILLALMCILCIISFLAFLYNRNTKTFVDDGHFWSLIEYGFQVFDFVTDCNLSYELLTYVLRDYGGTGNKNIYIFLSAIGVTGFTIIPYFINVYKSISIKKLVKNNIVAKLYFEQNTSLFVFMVMCSSGLYSTLKVLSSRIFGLRILDCGLTKYDLRQLLPIKIYTSVLMENLPQVICQFLYVNALGHVTFNTAMSACTSLLSILWALISFYIKNQSLLNSEAIIYYLELCKTKNKDLNYNEKQNMIKFKGLKKKLRNSIAVIFGVQMSCFEVGYITLTQNGCIIHMVQYVFRDDLREILIRLDKNISKQSISWQRNNKRFASNNQSFNSMWSDMASTTFVKRLYKVCNAKIVDTLCKHFDLNNDNNEFITKYHQSFPYKFEDNILNNNYNDVEMVFKLENNNSMYEMTDTEDFYVRLEDDDQ